MCLVDPTMFQSHSYTQFPKKTLELHILRPTFLKHTRSSRLPRKSSGNSALALAQAVPSACDAPLPPNLQSPSSLLWRSCQSLSAQKTSESLFLQPLQRIWELSFIILKMSIYIVLYGLQKAFLYIISLYFHKIPLFSALFWREKGEEIFRISDKSLLLEPHFYL